MLLIQSKTTVKNASLVFFSPFSSRLSVVDTRMCLLTCQLGGITKCKSCIEFKKALNLGMPVYQTGNVTEMS